MQIVIENWKQNIKRFSEIKWRINCINILLRTHIFQAVLLAKSSKHRVMHVKFFQLRMAIEETSEINLWKSLKGVVVTSKFHFHIKTLHLSCELKHPCYCIPGPLKPWYGQRLKGHKFSKQNIVNSPWSEQKHVLTVRFFRLSSRKAISKKLFYTLF